MRLEIRTVVNP